MRLHRGGFPALIAILFLHGTTAAAAPPLTEDEAVRIFLSGSPLARMGSLRAEAAGAEVRAGASVSNPAVAYSVEDAGDTRDEFLVLEQELPITGRRSLIRKSADRASAAARLAAEADLRRAVNDLRATFYEVLHRQRTLEVLREGASELERVAGVLREREAGGEGSGYDVVRAEQELAGLGIRISRAGAGLAGAAARLESFFPEALHPLSREIRGDFGLGDALPEPADAVAFALEHRSDLLALDAAAERHDLESKAARRAGIPEPILGAGIKRVEGAGEADEGPVVSLTLPLPIFNRGQLEASRARAEAGVVAAERELLRRRIESEVRAAHSDAVNAREWARSSGDIDRRAAALAEIARVAYEEGEHGILERLDAHRAWLEGRLLALEAGYEAKRAAIELDRAMGREVTP